MGGRGGRGGGGIVEGLQVGEAIPAPVLQPPPTFPPLDAAPAPLPPHSQPPDLLLFRRLLSAHWARLPVQLDPPAPSYRRETAESEPKEKGVTLEWSRVPSELRPGRECKRKRRQPKPVKAPRVTAPPANLDQLLSVLEKTERLEVKAEAEEEEEEERGEEEDDEAEEEMDEEMDEGTDYNQNYFDNGEGYLDEDDDLDDGPIY